MERDEFNESEINTDEIVDFIILWSLVQRCQEIGKSAFFF